SVGNLDPFDVLFADPPYCKGLGEKAMAAAAEGGWLRQGAIAVLEERADIVVSVHPSPVFLESRIFGDTRVHFFRY
ncbi:RsmD family RNA methyltransferase, partial [Rhizobium leguminosarum]|uniref:RsmD family RNA methyltransferase n=1 Tax=Rhizobium leguminosarum TaxID=384 RepID=UPI003F9EA5C9